MSKMGDEEKGFIRGVAWAVQILAARGEDTFAGELISNSGFTTKDFKAAAVDEYDMKAVRKIKRSERV
jgi:hypothetical protein